MSSLPHPKQLNNDNDETHNQITHYCSLFFFCYFFFLSSLIKPPLPSPESTSPPYHLFPITLQPRSHKPTTSLAKHNPNYNSSLDKPSGFFTLILLKSHPKTTKKSQKSTSIIAQQPINNSHHHILKS